MKSVLISIKPKYCELIANGKKTVEVRKTKPKLELPFKCYIYCTKAKDIYSIGGGLYDYKDNLYRLPTGEIKFGDGFELVGDWRGQYDETNFLNGKVIGEFVCDRIDGFLCYDYITPTMVSVGKMGCLSPQELIDYIGNKTGYGWHITDLVIYDKPKELFDFANYDKYQVCKEKNCFSDNCWICPNNALVVRPPQSWCYVEELGV